MWHCDGASVFQIVPAVVQTARNNFHEIDFRDSFLKIESFAVGFCDDRTTMLIENIFCNFNMDSSKYNSLLQWMKTVEGKKQIAEVEKDAWVPFNKEFPERGQK